MSKRIQLKRTKGWRLANHSHNAIIVDRRGLWGNQYLVKEHGREEAVRKHAEFWLHGIKNFGASKRFRQLHNTDLACWCALDQPCHADFLMIAARLSNITYRGWLLSPEQIELFMTSPWSEFNGQSPFELVQQGWESTEKVINYFRQKFTVNNGYR